MVFGHSSHSSHPSYLVSLSWFFELEIFFPLPYLHLDWHLSNLNAVITMFSWRVDLSTRVRRFTPEIRYKAKAWLDEYAWPRRWPSLSLVRDWKSNLFCHRVLPSSIEDVTAEGWRDSSWIDWIGLWCEMWVMLDHRDGDWKPSKNGEW